MWTTINGALATIGAGALFTIPALTVMLIGASRRIARLEYRVSVQDQTMAAWRSAGGGTIGSIPVSREFGSGSLWVLPLEANRN